MGQQLGQLAVFGGVVGGKRRVQLRQQQAMAMLNDGKTGPAVNKLEAFQHEVDALMSGNDPVLTYDLGQPPFDCVQGVIDQLGG